MFHQSEKRLIKVVCILFNSSTTDNCAKILYLLLLPVPIVVTNNCQTYSSSDDVSIHMDLYYTSEHFLKVKLYTQCIAPTVGEIFSNYMYLD